MLPSTAAAGAAALDSAAAALEEAGGDLDAGGVTSVGLASVDPVSTARGFSAVVSELFVDWGGGGVPKSSANDFQ